MLLGEDGEKNRGICERCTKDGLSSSQLSWPKGITAVWATKKEELLGQKQKRRHNKDVSFFLKFLISVPCI